MSTDVEHVMNIKAMQKFDSSLRIPRLQLITAGTEGRGRRVEELRPHMLGLLSQIDHIFFEQSFNTVEHAENAVDACIRQRSLDSPYQAGVDDGCGPARLPNNEIEAVLYHDLIITLGGGIGSPDAIASSIQLAMASRPCRTASS